MSRKVNARRLAPLPPPVREIPRCVCGHSGMLHQGAKDSGVCFLCHDCTGYREAPRVDA